MMWLWLIVMLVGAWLAGRLALRFVLRGEGFLSSVWALPVGLGIIGGVDFFLRLAAPPWHFAILNTAVLAAAIAEIALRVAGFRPGATRVRWSGWKAALGTATLVLIGAALLARALVMPVEAWDSVAMHTNKARILFIEPRLDRFLDVSWRPHPHPDYPILIHLAESWLTQADTARTWRDEPVKVLSPLLVLSLALSMFCVLRRQGLFIAVAVPAAFLLCPVTLEYAVRNMLDLPLAFYFTASALALARYDERRGAEWLFMACALAALASFVKNEGVVFLLFIVALALWRGWRDRSDFRWTSSARFATAMAAGCLLVRIGWFVLLRWNDVGESNVTRGGEVDPLTLFSAERWGVILEALHEQIASVRRWGMVAPVAVVGGALGALYRRNVYAHCFLFMAAAYLAVYALTTEDLVWHLETSLERLALQIFPLGLLAAFHAGASHQSALS